MNTDRIILASKLLKVGETIFRVTTIHWQFCLVGSEISDLLPQASSQYYEKENVVYTVLNIDGKQYQLYHACFLVNQQLNYSHTCWKCA